MILNILLPVACTLLSYVFFFVIRILYRNWTSPLKFVDGPSCANPVLGHLQLISDSPEITNEWRAQYGATFMAKGIFFTNELHTKDLKAVTHIVTHAALYQKTRTALGNQRRILGQGILSVDLDPHKRQRRVLNPAFGIQQIRAMNEVFVEKGNMMRDMLSKRLGDERGPVTIDLSSWFRQVTLDIIGQAGFGYQFQALQTHGKEEAELSTVLRQLFHSPKANLYRSIQMAQILVPALKLLPLPGSYVTLVAQTRLRAIGKTLLNDSKAESAAISDAKHFNRGRDLLSLLIKANMSNEIPASQRLSDDEVIAQIATFVFAGHETTSTALSWAAHALSRNPDIQEKLRQELLSLPTDNPSMDELNSLPFLENFVRETMRLYSPVAFTQRMASQDDVLPLTKPYVDRYGVLHEVLPIRKGQIITIPILAINTDTETWGEDALEFQPERWDNLPDAAHLIPGIWAHQMTFLAGPHNCIGFRFTLVEQKAILFSLLRAFEFSPGAERVEPVLSGPLQRPVSFVPGKSGFVSTGTLAINISAYKAES